jgi:sec-independent protein translocase protein TatA
MPFKLGTTELIILLVIVLLLFGVGRIGKLFGEFGKAIRELRHGLAEEENADEETKAQKT